MALQTDLSAIQSSTEIESESPPEEHPGACAASTTASSSRTPNAVTEFVRASDRELWAVERDDVLVSARSGVVLAQRRGRVYFAADDDAPLYYERAI